MAGCGRVSHYPSEVAAISPPFPEDGSRGGGGKAGERLRRLAKALAQAPDKRRETQTTSGTTASSRFAIAFERVSPVPFINAEVAFIRTFIRVASYQRNRAVSARNIAEEDDCQMEI